MFRPWPTPHWAAEPSSTSTGASKAFLSGSCEETNSKSDVITLKLYAVIERYLVNHMDAVVVSVHYCLAPEYPYPIPFEDCLTAIKYLHRHHQHFGRDATQISIAGDSAGANIAAGIFLKLRDTNQNFLHRQILLSPVTQVSSFLTYSFRDNAKYAIFIEPTFFLEYINVSTDHADAVCANEHVVHEEMIHHKARPYLKNYHKINHEDVVRKEHVARDFGRRIEDPYLCPMMADSLKGLSPALVLVTEHDPFRDDALAYADRLQADGIEMEAVRAFGFHRIYYFFDRSVSGGRMIDAVVNYMRTVYEK
ncbi:putative Arylacetamide deacetylase [Hypsibius exemplaris]|uniref:Arylacetamide deacetylase n=1 Tax=Hypsibius exemplaris TaxID=2072580 RepID=A0A1W0XBR5_HYPEX|nr:putative Arylacetamide deacetylase [Hypsibius exemplaris]